MNHDVIMLSDVKWSKTLMKNIPEKKRNCVINFYDCTCIETYNEVDNLVFSKPGPILN